MIGFVMTGFVMTNESCYNVSARALLAVGAFISGRNVASFPGPPGDCTGKETNRRNGLGTYNVRDRTTRQGRRTRFI